MDPVMTGAWYCLIWFIVHASYPEKCKNRYWNRHACPAERTKPDCHTEDRVSKLGTEKGEQGLTVSVEPFRVGGVVSHFITPESDTDGGGAHDGSRMTAFELPRAGLEQVSGGEEKSVPVGIGRLLDIESCSRRVVPPWAVSQVTSALRHSISKDSIYRRDLVRDLGFFLQSLGTVEVVPSDR
jgi:hypothetical protein